MGTITIYSHIDADGGVSYSLDSCPYTTTFDEFLLDEMSRDPQHPIFIRRDRVFIRSTNYGMVVYQLGLAHPYAPRRLATRVSHQHD